MNGRSTHSETAFKSVSGALEGPTSQDISDGRTGQSMRLDDKLTRADYPLSQKTSVSVGVQTDPVADDTPTPSRTPRQSMFSIGGRGGPSRKDSVISCTDSGIENGNLDVDTSSGGHIQSAEPRPTAECLTIYKSDVRKPYFLCKYSMYT